MTRGEFIGILEEKGYSYEMEGDKIVITHGSQVNLRLLKTLPSGVEFNNEGSVWLNSLETLPPGVGFKNKGSVWLDSLKNIPPGVRFKNGENVRLDSLKNIPPGVRFKNGENVRLDSLKNIPPGVMFNNKGDVYSEPLIGGRLKDWNGVIKGVDPKRLLNEMIELGLFDRR